MSENLINFLEECPVRDDYIEYRDLPFIGDLFILYVANNLENQLSELNPNSNGGNKLEIIIPIGIPGAGKTNYYKKKHLNEKYIQVSGDNIRFALFGYKNRTNFDFISELEFAVKLLFFESINWGLEHKCSLYLDECNTDINDLLEIISFIVNKCKSLKIDFKITLLYNFTTPHKASINQKKRDRQILYHILESKYGQLKDNFDYFINRLYKYPEFDSILIQNLDNFKEIDFKHPYYKLEDSFFTHITTPYNVMKKGYETYGMVSIKLNGEHKFFAQIVQIKESKLINIPLELLKKEVSFPSFEINNHLEYMEFINNQPYVSNSDLIGKRSILFLRKLDKLKLK